jgi:hypothetical protein
VEILSQKNEIMLRINSDENTEAIFLRLVIINYFYPEVENSSPLFKKTSNEGLDI